MFFFKRLTPANNTALTHWVLENRSLFANFWATLCYAFAFVQLGAPVWKSAVVAMVVMICCTMQLHRQEIRTVGLLLLGVGLCIWTGLLPPVRG